MMVRRLDYAGRCARTIKVNRIYMTGTGSPKSFLANGRSSQGKKELCDEVLCCL